MDGHREELSFLSASLRRTIDDVDRSVAAWLAPQQVRGAHYTAYLAVTIDAVRQRLNGLTARASTSDDIDDIEAISRQVRLLRQSILFLLPLIGSAADRATKPSLSLVYFLEESAGLLLQADADLVIRAAPDYNLSIAGLESPFRDLLRPLGVEPPKGPTPLLIKYPIIEADRVLLHPLFVHELGHEVVRRTGLRDRILARHPNPEALNRSFGETVERVRQEHETGGRPISREEVESSVRTIMNGWIDELLCDLIASAYTGPSFLFAATAFLFVSPKTEGSLTHPPSYLRIRLVLDYLQDLGWMEALKRRLPAIMAWLDLLGAPQPLKPADNLRAFARGVVADVSANMRSTVTKDLDAAVFLHGQYQSVADELESLLSHGIPPVQLAAGGAAGRCEIMMACWLHSLSSSGDNAASVAEALVDTSRQRFFAKAIEMSYVLEQWGRA